MLQIQSYEHNVLFGVRVGLVIFHSSVLVRRLQVDVFCEVVAQAHAAGRGSVVDFLPGILSCLRLVPVVAAHHKPRKLLGKTPPEIK